MAKYPIRCRGKKNDIIGYFTINDVLVKDFDGYPMYFGKLIDSTGKIVGSYRCYTQSFPLRPIWWDRKGNKHLAGYFCNRLGARITDILVGHYEECPF